MQMKVIHKYTKQPKQQPQHDHNCTFSWDYDSLKFKSNCTIMQFKSNRLYYISSFIFYFNFCYKIKLIYGFRSLAGIFLTVEILIRSDIFLHSLGVGGGDNNCIGRIDMKTCIHSLNSENRVMLAVSRGIEHNRNNRSCG